MAATKFKPIIHRKDLSLLDRTYRPHHRHHRLENSRFQKEPMYESK